MENVTSICRRRNLLISRHRMDFAEYLRLQAASVSQLLEMAESPKHYRYRLGHAREDVAALRLGRAAHTAVLEPTRFLTDYALMPAEFPDAKGAMKPATRKLNSCEAWCVEREQAGTTILTREQAGTAKRIREEVLAHGPASALLTGGEAEVTLAWTDEETGIPRRARLDYLVTGGGGTAPVVTDLKTTRHCGHTAFARDCARLMYHVRLASYADAVEMLTGDFPEVRIIAVQSVEPHDVAVYRVDTADLDRGREVYRDLMGRLKACLDADYWPGVAETEEVGLQLPAWVDGGRGDLETLSLTSGGAPMIF